MKKIHIGKSFRVAENFTLTLIINSYINQRNFANFAKFKLIRKILSRGTWSYTQKIIHAFSDSHFFIRESLSDEKLSIT